MRKYTVVQTRFEHIPIDVLREAFVAYGVMPRADVSRAVRTARGLLIEQCDRNVADGIQRFLADRDFGVRTVESEDIPHLPEPRTIRWLEIDKEEFRIPEGIHGQTIPMSWKSVFVLAIAQIAVADVTHRIDDPTPIQPIEESPVDQHEHPRYQRHSDLVDVLEVIGIDRNEQLRYLRLPSHELAYQRIMGSGTHLPKFERFLVLVEFFVEHSDEAIVSSETRKRLVQRSPTERSLVSEAARTTTKRSTEQYMRWLLHQAVRREELKKVQT